MLASDNSYEGILASMPHIYKKHSCAFCGKIFDTSSLCRCSFIPDMLYTYNTVETHPVLPVEKRIPELIPILAFPSTT